MEHLRRKWNSNKRAYRVHESIKNKRSNRLNEISAYQPPLFEPHRWLRGGHLQTLATVWGDAGTQFNGQQHIVTLPDNDAVVLHENRPQGWSAGQPCVLLVHGLCGSHQASYMGRLAAQFLAKGVRVFRIDMRGCGAGFNLSKQLTHAGRGDDLICALDFIDQTSPNSRLGVIAVSLGGNQILAALGKIGAGLSRTPAWFDRLDRVATVSPPVDLLRCSANMQRRIMWPYNYYFVRKLLSRIPPRVKLRDDFQHQIIRRRPRTLFDLDDQLTAPLSGFTDALDYYSQASASRYVDTNPIPTLVLASTDDPVVPVDCFRASSQPWPDKTTVCIAKHGGHVGFIDRRNGYWMDRALEAWFKGFA